MEPQFPLPIAPECQICGRPCTRDIVSAENRNGYAGRPYYYCIDDRHPRKFSSWDDSQGIVEGNPQCRCGFTSRRTTTNGPNPKDFYSCPAGDCRYSRDAPLAPEANSVVVVRWVHGYAEPRPEVNSVAAVRWDLGYAEPRPEASSVAAVRRDPRYAELRPEVNSVAAVRRDPRYAEPRPEVDMVAQHVGMGHTYEKHRHCCCVVM